MADFHLTADGYAVNYSSDPVEQMVVTCPNVTTVVTKNADGTETRTDTGVRTRCARVAMSDAPDPVTDEYKQEVAARLKTLVASLRASGCVACGTQPAAASGQPAGTALSTMTEAEKQALLA